jgi:hypothetical protein
MKIKHIVSETEWSDVISGGLNLARDAARDAYGAYRTTPSGISLVKDDTGIGYSTMKDGSWYAVDGPNKGKKVSPEKEKEIIALLARKIRNQIPNERTLRDLRSKRKVAQQTTATTRQPAQAVQRPTQQTVTIGGQTLDPNNPSHAKIIAQANQQHTIPKAAPAPTQKPKYKPDGRGGFTRISERADFSAMLLRRLNENI